MQQLGKTNLNLAPQQQPIEMAADVRVAKKLKGMNASTKRLYQIIQTQR